MIEAKILSQVPLLCKALNLETHIFEMLNPFHFKSQLPK